MKRLIVNSAVFGAALALWWEGCSLMLEGLYDVITIAVKVWKGER